MVGDGVAKAAGVSTDLVDGSGCFPAVKRLCKFGEKPTVLVAREGFRVGEHGGKQVDGDLAVSEEGDVFRSRDIAEGNVDRGELSSQNRSYESVVGEQQGGVEEAEGRRQREGYG
ncbi:hypothetical protein WJX75_004469 [Coccomyxa subellipsoidea]|uniref:Uncharacterized protein n=1 Tax=Coccomyxa subellipsoidea TaxID=248742 RepID=A0ABR2YMI5_9CHLO